MPRLSRDHSTMAPHYAAIVIGSGYGGGVAASRLARMGLQVAVFERGREFRPGDFPDTLPEAQNELRFVGKDGHLGRPDALYEMHMGEDIHVLVGNGLGGTSLINAGVALAPDPRVFEDPIWPRALLTDDALDEGFKRAKAMLRPQTFPTTLRLDKYQRLEEAGRQLGTPAKRAPINVAFTAGPNAAGVEQSACTSCGDCCSGCNVGAKTTVDITYIADAVAHGAHVFTLINVLHVEQAATGWRVVYAGHGAGSAFDAPPMSISADRVFIAAGSLGSTGILLRSRAKGLIVSPRLGQGFTGNGDVLAFAYNGQNPANAIGVGHPARANVAPPGPTISGIIDLRDSAHLEDGLVIEEGVIPSALHPLLPALFSSSAHIFAKPTDTDLADTLVEKAMVAESAVLGSYYGAMHRTQTYLVMAHDDGRGALRLKGDRIAVDWPGVARQSVYQRIDDRLFAAAKAEGADYLKNPAQSTFLGEKLVTVHPLGGCGMGETAELGVVDDRGRVFDPQRGNGAVHDGLFVLDGAILPRSIGINPLLTISALAERALMKLGAELGQDPMRPKVVAVPPLGLTAEALTPAGVTFTERMSGAVARVEGHATKPLETSRGVYAQAAQADARRDLVLMATITIADVNQFIDDPNHTATLSGTIMCPLIAPDALTLRDGTFNLMRPDPDRPETCRFDYVGRVLTPDGRAYAFTGHKFVHNRRGALDLWTDTTTLSVMLASLPPAAGGPLTKPDILLGQLRIRPDDFARQLSTLKGTGGRDVAERLAAVGRFGSLFAGSLFSIFGGVAVPLDRFDPAAVRRRRELRAPQPSVHQFLTADGKLLRLTRFKGGTKGPLLFLHGLGVSSRIFSTDTIDTNLVEFLTAQGYDCWLLDFRASIDLPFAEEPATADIIATDDIPRGVAEVLRLTGAPNLQVMAHCYGGTTFTMALLAGLQGVRSAVISQISADVVVPFFPQRLLAHLRLPNLLAAVGIGHVDARTTTTHGLLNRAIDLIIRLFVPFRPEARSASGTSNRITALYGQLYEIDNLNRLTFDYGLPEMFGTANTQAFKHLALIARRQQIVDAEGRDVYLPHIDRLGLPLLIIHGEKNRCFAPISTQRTEKRIAQSTGTRHFTRKVIPGYGHIDCIFGRDAARDVFPHILAHLDQTAVTARPAT